VGRLREVDPRYPADQISNPPLPLRFIRLYRTAKMCAVRTVHSLQVVIARGWNRCGTQERQTLRDIMQWEKMFNGFDVICKQPFFSFSSKLTPSMNEECIENLIKQTRRRRWQHSLSYYKLDIDVVARRSGVGTHLMCRFQELLHVALRHAGNLSLQLDSEIEVRAVLVEIHRSGDA